MQSEMISTLEMSIIDVNSEFMGVERRLLMENAGRGLADLVWKIFQSEKRENVIIFAGKGGNGGDGMVAARHLARHIPVKLYLLGSENDIIKKSTLGNWKILKQMPDSINIYELKHVNDISKIEIEEETLIIDALLGTGIKGDIREPLSILLRFINECQQNGAFVISVDTPTGIDPSSGRRSNVFITPQWTVVFHKQKEGLSSENAGNIEILPIGVPPEAEQLIGPGDLLALKPRSSWSKKGENGKILIIGGNETYSGAPALAAMGAIQAGVDLVTILAPQKISTSIRSYSPEFIVEDYSYPHLSLDSVSEEIIAQNDIIVLGPGLGRHIETKKAVHQIMKIIRKNNKSVVIDADALKLMNMSEVTPKTVLTPHAGEFAVLTKISIPAGEKNFHRREQIAKEVSSKYPCTWIVKGHWDIVMNETNFKINKTGTARMTRGGTGDILAGLTAGFMVQTESVFHGACIGVYINGRAGELVEKEFSLSNLLKGVPLAIEESFDFILND